MKKAIIIGAGIGGLHTGIRLAHAGFDVSLFEKNNFAGGVVNSVSIPGTNYLFEGSASIMLSPSQYGEIFKDCNVNPNDYFTTTPLKETYKVFTAHHGHFTLPSCLSDVEALLKSTFPSSLHGYFHLLTQTGKRFAIAQKHFLRRSFVSKKELCSPKLLYHTYRLHTLSSAYTYLKSLIPDQDLQDCLLFQTMFMGCSPFTIPNIYTAIPVVTQLEGLSHITGGMGAYSKALVQLFQERGGKLYLNHPVSDVVFDQSTAIGIHANSQLFKADTIIVGADYRYAYEQLLPLKIRKLLMGTSRFTNLKSSIGVFILRLVVKNPLTNLEVHNLIIPEHFTEAIQQTFTGTIPTELPAYVYYPGAVDSSFISDEGTCLHMMIRVPNLLDIPHWNTALIQSLTESCIQLLAHTVQMPHLKEQIAYSEVVTPSLFEADYHYYEGCAFGLAHTYSQSMAFRPQFTSPKVKNLYFVGSSVHPGNGVSIVMEGAKILSDHLITRC